MMKKLSNLYWTFAFVWYLTGFILHMAIIVYVIEQREPAVLVLLALWWIITLAARKIRHSAEKHRKRREQEKLQAYRDEFITEIPVDDDVFGRVVFEYDSNKDEIGTADYTLEKHFDRHEITLDCEIDGNDPAPAVAAARWIFENSSEILEKLCEETLETCNAYDERDKNGELYDMEYVRANLNVYCLYMCSVSDGVFIRLCCDIYGDDGKDLIGGHAIVARMRFDPLADSTVTPDDIEFTLEG